MRDEKYSDTIFKKILSILFDKISNRYALEFKLEENGVEDRDEKNFKVSR